MAKLAEPPPGNAADASSSVGTGAEELHLYFPIEVEVRAVETPHDADAAAERAVGRFVRGIKSAT
jgi:hypothetical protein